MSILTFSSAFAQRRNTTTEKTNDDNDDNYTSSSLFGLTTGTNSGLLGGFMYRKTFITAKKSENQQYHYINLELVNVKHYREYSSSNTTSGRNFIDGKINYLFAVRPQYGRLISLFKKSPEGGVTINGIIAAGPTIGLLKPYFVEITYLDATTNRAKYVSVPNAADLTVNYPRAQVAGEGGFFEGFGQMNIVPGANLKLALDIELDAFRQSSINLEIGFLAEVYSKKVEIMTGTENRSFFTSGYLTIFFGSRK